MKYVANPIAVDAFKIVSVGRTDEALRVHVATDDGKTRIADPGMLARYRPKAGDYWVIQADGYEYLNPKDVFEHKYTPFQGEFDAIQETRP